MHDLKLKISRQCFGHPATANVFFFIVFNVILSYMSYLLYIAGFVNS